jgi:hypothetical protein
LVVLGCRFVLEGSNHIQNCSYMTFEIFPLI